MKSVESHKIRKMLSGRYHVIYTGRIYGNDRFLVWNEKRRECWMIGMKMTKSKNEGLNRD